MAMVSGHSYSARLILNKKQQNLWKCVQWNSNKEECTLLCVLSELVAKATFIQKATGSSTETRVSFLQLPVYKSVYTESALVCGI